MNIRALAWTVGVVLGALGSSPIACSQPNVECQVAHAGASGYASTFTLVGEAPACAAGKLQKGDVIGFESYHPVMETDDGPAQDFRETTVAIQANAMGSAVASHGLDLAAKPYALGAFASTAPDDDGFCTVENLAPAEQSLAAVPEDDSTTETEALPAIDLRYDWRNVKVYVTAEARGTQFAADLTLTIDGCAVDYRVVGVWPVVSCEGALADGSPNGMPDASLCAPKVDPEGGRQEGSALNADFPVVCDPDLLYCVLKGEPPALAH